MQSNTAAHRLLSRPTDHSNNPERPNPDTARVVGFYGPPPDAEAALCAEVKRGPANARSGWCCWASLFCCSPGQELIEEETIHNWKAMGVANQYTLVSGSASRVLFNGDELVALTAGLKDMWLPDQEVTELARSVNDALTVLTTCKRDLSSDAAGISGRSIDGLLNQARNLGTALQNLDQFAKQDRKNPKASQLLARGLWQPCSVSPDRPTGGAGPAVLTPMDRFRANLSLDIEALESLKARIPT